MKKLIIFLGVLLSANAVFGQALKPVKVDSLVTVSLPVAYSKKDTLGQQLLSANTDFGYMIAIREPNAKGNQPLQKEKDLNSVLKNYIKSIQSQSQGGSAQFVRDTTVGTLKAKAFTLVMKDANGDEQYRNFVLLYTKDVTYTFEYGYIGARKEMVKDESKAFLSSIRLSPELQRNDQYIDTTGKSSASISPVGIIAIAGGIVLILGIGWLIYKKKNSNEFA